MYNPLYNSVKISTSLTRFPLIERVRLSHLPSRYL